MRHVNPAGTFGQLARVDLVAAPGFVLGTAQMAAAVIAVVLQREPVLPRDRLT